MGRGLLRVSRAGTGVACEGDTWAVTGWGAGGEERRTLQAWEKSSVGTPLAALRGWGWWGGGAERSRGLGSGLRAKQEELRGLEPDPCSWAFVNTLTPWLWGLLAEDLHHPEAFPPHAHHQAPVDTPGRAAWPHGGSSCIASGSRSRVPVLRPALSRPHSRSLDSVERGSPGVDTDHRRGWSSFRPGGLWEASPCAPPPSP